MESKLRVAWPVVIGVAPRQHCGKTEALAHRGAHARTRGGVRHRDGTVSCVGQTMHGAIGSDRLRRLRGRSRRDHGAGALLAPRRAFVAYVWQSLAGLLLHQQVDNLTGTMREAAEEFDASEAARARGICERGAELAEAAGFDAQAISAQGSPKAWPTLLRGAVKSAVLGSVSGGLLHHSKLPVLVVPGKSDRPGQGPVLIAYDGSTHARRGIEAAAGLLGSRKGDRSDRLVLLRGDRGCRRHRRAGRSGGGGGSAHGRGARPEGRRAGR